MITAICLLAYRNVRMSGIVCKTSLPDAEKYSGYRTRTADVNDVCSMFVQHYLFTAARYVTSAACLLLIADVISDGHVSTDHVTDHVTHTVHVRRVNHTPVVDT